MTTAAELRPGDVILVVDPVYGDRTRTVEDTKTAGGWTEIRLTDGSGWTTRADKQVRKV